jgi:hypothetical protein
VVAYRDYLETALNHRRVQLVRWKDAVGAIGVGVKIDRILRPVGLRHGILEATLDWFSLASIVVG